MKKIFIVTVALLAITCFTYGQINYLDQGNQYLTEGNNSAAEKTFREAIKSDSSNLIYQCQLALSLINQDKFAEAQQTIDKVLSKDSTNAGAIWYGGMNSFLNKKGDLRKSVSYFEKAIPLLNDKQGQFYGANWFIGRSYQILLQTDGLSYEEVSRMLDCYSTYVRLQPNAGDASKISSFISHINEIRPPANVKKWVNIQQSK